MPLNFGLTPEILAKGLAIRSPNWLGDAIMALPAIKCLKQMLPPDAPCYVVSPANLASLYESIPFINKVIKIDSGHSKWTKEILDEVKCLNAGFGFLFVNSLRSAWYFRKCVQKLYGSSNGLRDLLLSKAFKVKWNENKSYTNEHQSYKYLSMVYALGGSKWDEKYPDFKLLSESEVSLEGVIDFIKPEKTLVVAPGAAYGPAKRWDPQNYNRVCRYWIKKKDGNVIVLGAKNELDSAAAVADGLNAKCVLNLAGKTNLQELIFILKKANFCICNDSGMMHLGSALDIKGISVFGSTDPYATGPLSKNWKVLIKKQECSPCFSRECVNPLKDYRCLKSITSDELINAINEMGI